MMTKMVERLDKMNDKVDKMNGNLDEIIDGQERLYNLSN